MSRLCPLLVLVAGCASGARGASVQAPLGLAVPASSDAAPSAERKRVARLSPPFASGASTRRVLSPDTEREPAPTLPEPVELAIAH